MRTLSFFADSKEGRDMAGGHEIKDTSRLTDADWAEINKLRRAYDSGGDEALKRAYKDLCKGNPIRWVRVIGAYFPDYVREKLKDAMADLGMTIEDLRDRSENPNRRPVQSTEPTPSAAK